MRRPCWDGVVENGKEIFKILITYLFGCTLVLVVARGIFDLCGMQFLSFASCSLFVVDVGS